MTHQTAPSNLAEAGTGITGRRITGASGHALRHFGAFVARAAAKSARTAIAQPRR